jgi:hypothetical protein
MTQADIAWKCSVISELAEELLDHLQISGGDEIIGILASRNLSGSCARASRGLRGCQSPQMADGEESDIANE